MPFVVNNDETQAETGFQSESTVSFAEMTMDRLRRLFHQPAWMVIAVSLLGGCALIQPRLSFSSFPARFQAIQVLRVSGSTPSGKIDVEFLTTVTRDGADVEVVFLDAIWQSPLLKLSYKDGSYRSTPLREGATLPFRSEEILETAQDVFHWQGALDDRGEAQLSTRRFRVRLQDIGGTTECPFPRRMELIPHSPDAPRIMIQSRDWKCR